MRFSVLKIILKLDEVSPTLIEKLSDSLFLTSSITGSGGAPRIGFNTREPQTDFDVLGNVYEEVIQDIMTGKVLGQFFTQPLIKKMMVKLIDPQIYPDGKIDSCGDPTMGTGGFLISSYKHILKTNTDKKPGDLLSASDRKKVGENIGGYDISPEMIKLSLVNMYLHGFSTPDIEEYDTLSSEDNWNEYYDVILANPPFFSPSGGIQPHKRFGVESKKAEVLFTSYILEHLKPNGRAGIIVPEGIIFQNGTAYKELRKQLMEGGLVVVFSASVFS